MYYCSNKKPRAMRLLLNAADAMVERSENNLAPFLIKK